MSYFEVIYETGAHSLADYEDENEAIAAVKAHHARALAGETGGPPGHPAERITRVLMYKDYPGDTVFEEATGPHESNYQMKETKELEGWQ